MTTNIEEKANTNLVDKAPQQIPKKCSYKIYKTVDEQVEYLKNNKKVIINSKQRHFLEERNYISIINPYKDFFASGHITKVDNGRETKIHIYKNETNILQYKLMADTDDEISKYLYDSIGIFERRFKNMVIQEICGLYNSNSKNDLYCLDYIEDIHNFIINESIESLPIFCTNFYNIINNDKYSYSDFHKESRIALLEKIHDIGLGLNKNKNSLISHYVKQQQKAPLWVVPNAMTLGELNILFSMLDCSSQKNVMSRVLNKISNNIRIRDIFAFQAYLEVIRRIRNVINHYEPLIPFFITNITDKKIGNSQVIKTIEVLQSVFKESNCYNTFNHIFPDIIEHEYNRKKINIIKTIINTLK